MDILTGSSLANLRRLRRDDLALFQAYRNDSEVARYQSWTRLTNAEALKFLTHMETVPLFAPGKWCQIAISAPKTNELLGDMGLFLSADTTTVEIGITLAPEHQGRGKATQALQSAFDLTWACSPADTIRAWGDQRNTAAIALMRRAGMTHLGTETGEVVEEAFALTRPINP